MPRSLPPTVNRRRSRPALAVLLASMVFSIAGLGGVPGAVPAAGADTNDIPLVRNVGSVAIPISDITPRGSGGQFAWGIHLEDGTDWGYSPCHPGDPYYSSCPAGPFGYYRADHWTAGSVAEVSPQLTIPNSTGGQNHQWANRAKGARIEIYPYGGGGNYDPWTQDVGGVAINAFGVDGAGNGPNLGEIHLPVRGEANVGRIGGGLTSKQPSANGRVIVSVFQEHSIYDSYPYQTTSSGFDVGGFAEVGSRGAAWTSGWTYEGLHHVFIHDTKSTPSTADDVKVEAMIVIVGDLTLDLDLDATCFGLDECQVDLPAPPFQPVLNAGGFHPLTPARIMDTRDGTGRFFGFPGPVTQGDGSSPGEPNNITRAQNQVNHEAKVTGVGGVPATGVSAVVLNVTVTGGTAPSSFLSVFPKPPRTFVYGDQSSFGPGTVPDSSNLNFSGGQTIANLVVVRVGAGGKVRFKNNSGLTHVIFDVVGWYDTGATTGDTFTGVTPTRLLDSRPGAAEGPFHTKFGAGAMGDPTGDRELAVTGGDVPVDATGVVLNVTGLDANQTTYLAVYPSGVSRPVVSNLNFGQGGVVPNLVMVKVGTGGKVRIYNNSGSTNAIVDLVGYYRAAGAARFTPMAQPTRILDSRLGIGTTASKFGAGEERLVVVGGANGVPADATAVIMNVTVTEATAGSHLTVFPAGVGMPVASNLNFSAGQTVPNLVMVKLAGNGKVKIFNNAGATHVIADVAGYIA